MRLLVLHEKHGSRTFVIDTDEDKRNAIFGVIGERLEEGYWYYDETEESARAILESQNLSAAWAFLYARSECEYERIEEIETSEF